MHGRPYDPLSLFNKSRQSSRLALSLQLAIITHYQVHVAHQVNLVDLVFHANLIQALNQFLLKVYGLPHFILAHAHSLVEPHDLYIEQCQIRKLVHLPLVLLDGIEDVEWNQLTDQLVGLLGLHVEHTFIVYLLALNHFAVVNACRQKDRVQELTKDELYDLVLEFLGYKSYSGYPGDHIYAVGDDVVTQEDIPHHEDQGHRKLYLKFIEASNCPHTQIFCLI